MSTPEDADDAGTPDDGPGETSELLARATDELRRAPEREPTWQDISGAVVGALRAAGRRTTWVTVGLDGGTDPGRDVLVVGDQVLAGLVRRDLRTLAGCAPSGMAVDVDEEGRCTGVVVEVVAAFGADLRGVAAEVRARCSADRKSVV